MVCVVHPPHEVVGYGPYLLPTSGHMTEYLSWGILITFDKWLIVKVMKKQEKKI